MTDRRGLLSRSFIYLLTTQPFLKAANIYNVPKENPSSTRKTEADFPYLKRTQISVKMEGTDPSPELNKTPPKTRCKSTRTN